MSSADPNDFIQQRLSQFGVSRSVLLLVGIACALFGVAAIVLPFTTLDSIPLLVGWLLLGSGLAKAVQLVRGKLETKGGWHGWLYVGAQVALDFALGFVLLNWRLLGVEAVVWVLGGLFLLEGVVLLAVGRRSPTVRSRIVLWVIGLAIAGLGVVILLHLVNDPVRWAGVFVGIKLVLFGAALAAVAISARSESEALVYDTIAVEPVVGELYAVYFGTAFHLGVFVGDGSIIHYLDDSQVHLVSWEGFLEGRVPQHWTYPDLPHIPADQVVATARAEVNERYPYIFLKRNCEHFAIYCKSGGQTCYSRFAQVPLSMESVARHPVLGVVAELNTRIVEWLAFKLGGPSGKALSLRIREFGSAVTNWLTRHDRPPASHASAAAAQVVFGAAQRERQVTPPQVGGGA